MAVDEPEKIDVIGVDKKTGDVVLTISDHLGWEDEGSHLQILEQKLNSYLRFVENGEILEKYPAATGKPIVLRIVGLHPLTDRATRFYAEVADIVQGAGFTLQFELLQE
jgi:hypothetical protein